jgi:hypothetical protein
MLGARTSWVRGPLARMRYPESWVRGHPGCAGLWPACGTPNPGCVDILGARASGPQLNGKHPPPSSLLVRA